ncbi:uncharacterized protein LOC120570843 [Perca fluviatilis]|nr:uncharacterized protein LOC120570843 [Perca fluviatilis]
MGETIDYYIQVIMKQCSQDNILYINHYTMHVILNGSPEQKSGFTMRGTDFNKVQGAIGFVNERQHWKLVYLHTISKKIFTLDPLVLMDVDMVQRAIDAFSRFFKMRRNRLGKQEWTDIKWMPGAIQHSTQKDGSSCGVFVMQMARHIIEDFPQVPDKISIKGTYSAVQAYRIEMACKILDASEPLNQFCSYCGMTKLGKFKEEPEWMGCDECVRWYHRKCTKMSQKEYQMCIEKHWKCEYC